MTLDTRVEADPGACRAAGAWLRDAAERVHDAGTVLQRTRADSEAVWAGAAGEAFREHLRGRRQDADELSWSVRRSGEALLGFADDVDTVRARMAQARSVASDAGLTVTATGIEPPGPAPTIASSIPGAAPSNSDLNSLDVPLAAAAYQQKVAAWTEVRATVAQARGIELSAHQALLRRIRDERSLWDGIGTGSGVTAFGAVIGGPAALQHAHHRWRTAATAHRHDAAVAKAIFDRPDSTPAHRAQALRDYLSSAGRARAATRAAASNARALGPFSRSPVVRRLLRAGGRSVAGIPVLGAAQTAWQLREDIRTGQPADRTISAGAAGLAAGSVATVGVEYGAALALGAAGGPVTLGAVALGIGASVVATWAVDRYWDEIEDSAVGRAIGDSPVGRTIDRVF